MTRDLPPSSRWLIVRSRAVDSSGKNDLYKVLDLHRTLMQVVVCLDNVCVIDANKPKDLLLGEAINLVRQLIQGEEQS